MSIAILPELRFPEFDGEWKRKPVSEIGYFTKGTGVSKNDLVEGGSVPAIRYGELYTQYGANILDVVSRLESSNGLKISSGNEVLIPSSGETAYDIATASALTIEGVVLGGDINIFTTDNDPHFIAATIRGIRKLDIARLAQGISVSHVYGSEISTLSFNLPSLAEQKKIAGFLAAVDYKLSAMEAQLVGWREYKRGMMQALFSQSLRFKADDGSDFPEWKIMPLKKIAKRSTNKNTGYEVKRVLSNSALEGIVDQTSYFERNITTASNLDGYYIVKLGDFVYNPRVSKFAPVGPISRNNIADGVMSPLYTVFTPTPHAAAYLEAYFKSNDWNEYVYRVSNVGARHDRMNILTTDFMDMPIKLPCLPEQQKIVNALSTIDMKIEALTERLDNMHKFKRGLLQKMFV